MTAPSTDPSLPIEEALARLTEAAGHYYIKSSGIVEKIEYNGRTFYSKFRRVNRPVNAVLLRQHLHREVTLALPLLRHGRGRILVIEYLGEEPDRFIQTLKHLFAHLGYRDYGCYRGKREHRRTVILSLPEQSLESLHRLGEKLTGMLQTRLPKSWRILPDRHLPKSYNIYTLPYGYIN